MEKFFEQVSVICDVYFALYAQKGRPEGIVTTYQQKCGSLVEEGCAEQCKLLDHFFEGQNRQGTNDETLLWNIISLDFSRLFDGVLEYCRNVSSKSELIKAPVFIKGLNAILNGCDIWGIKRSSKDILMFLAGEVLTMYPDCGYRAAKYDYFPDKVKAVDLWIGKGDEISIAQKEVIVQENYKLQQKK